MARGRNWLAGRVLLRWTSCRSWLRAWEGSQGLSQHLVFPDANNHSESAKHPSVRRQVGQGRRISTTKFHDITPLINNIAPVIKTATSIKEFVEGGSLAIVLREIGGIERRTFGWRTV